ncbi:uncharacterized protein At3g27210 isoform X2 [Brassica napus]|uniref:uncharacterized protein At3g27210 isoform X2 n=1 Tax=Brassica napus TaxID=3708 RepID=UPI000BBEA65F|nr:uncharacterized protein At3g27210 isoform X2 [Brassica napus]
MGSSSSSLNKSAFRTDNMVTPESPTKDISSVEKNDAVVSIVSNSSPSTKKTFGSKDETFFDTQQWLQSDSDDDFHSVNGDFTPSRGNTPKCSFSDRPPRIQSLRFQDKKSSRGSSPAPRPRRKKLGELFRDSIRERPEESSAASSALSSPYLSVANSGEFSKAAIEDAGVKEQKKSNRQHHRCLPSFSSCGGSFMERRKKLSSETAVDAVK